MFGFNNKVNKEREANKEREVNKEIEDIKERNALEAKQRKFKKYWEWRDSEEFKRMSHLKTLIVNAYGTVNINMDNEYGRLDESFTRADLIEDFAIFFDPKVFDKLKDWCREYEALCKEEDKVIEEVERNQ